MKRILIVVMVLLTFSVTAMAETPQKKRQMPPEHGMMGQGMMQGGQMQMMQHMMGHGMMMKEMMHMMKDIMRIQDRLMAGVTDEDKKSMRLEINRMMERMDKMITDMQGMMMRCMTEMQKDETKQDSSQKPQEHKH